MSTTPGSGTAAPVPSISGWSVSSSSGRAGSFHQLNPTAEAGPEVWVRTIPSPALVLGSTQADELIVRRTAAEDGIEVCRRRSGGGLVWIDPESDTWIDVIVPRDSPLWDDDVGKAFHWLGDVWANVLAGCGFSVERHRGATTSPAGRLWCFADLGHGELSVDGSKILGLSQRRTRHWARLQSLVLGRWPGGELRRYVDLDVALLRHPDGPRSAETIDPNRVSAGFPADAGRPNPAELAARFVAALPAP